MIPSRTDGRVSFATITRWAVRLRELGLLDQARDDALLQALGEAQRGRLDQPPEPLLTVLLFGASGVGKSQLLNALAGEVIATAHFLRPTTRLPTVYAHEAVQAERLFEYGSALGDLTRLPATFQRHQREELRHMVLIDAPDIDSHVREHRQQVQQLLPVVDVVLYVVTPESYKNDCGWQAVLQERGRRAFAFVMNKWDREGKRRVPAGQADVDDDFLALLQQRGGYDNPLLFRVSAAYWVARHAHQAAEFTPADGEQFPELQRWLLSALSTSRIARLQRRRRRALWGSLAAAVAAAQLPAMDEPRWAAAATSAFGSLRDAGWQTLRPLIAARTRLVAHAYGLDTWPASPGPFGLCLRGIAAIRTFLHGVGARLSAIPWSGSQPGLPLLPAGPPTLGREFVPTRLGQGMEECLLGLELQARQHGVPVQWLGERWRELAGTVPARLAGVIEQVATAFLERPFGRARAVLGRTVLVGLELLLTAFLALVAWRLGTTFVAAAYLNVGFVAHVLALFGCLVFLGTMVLSWCFPRPEPLLRRRLEAQLGAAWNDIVAELEHTTSDFLAELAQLHQQGHQIMQSLNAEITVSSEPETSPAESDPDTARLFAHP